MRGKDGKFHLLYKVTNQLNNRFYIGKHSTRILEDGYLGSGKRIRYEVKKYGKENFVREIMEFCESDIKLNEREKEIVNEELLKEELCLNLKNGGEGGWKNINQDKEKHRADSARGGSKSGAKNWKKHHSEMSFEERLRRSKLAAKTKRKNETHQSFLGKSHSAETKKKMSSTNKERGNHIGEKNSQFGSMWISNGLEAKKIKNTDSIPEGWHRGRK